MISKILAGACLRVKHHHVKFAHRELQDKYLFLGVRQLGFQQDDVLQHPPFDLGQDALLHGGALRQRQGAECLIQQQTADQRIRLRIAESRLRDHRTRLDFVLTSGRCSTSISRVKSSKSRYSLISAA